MFRFGVPGLGGGKAIRDLFDLDDERPGIVVRDRKGRGFVGELHRPRVGQTVLYGELAGYYDRIYRFKDYPREARALLRLARRGLKRKPQSLLDVGCGTGHHLAEFRREVSSVAGVDLSPQMLALARRRLGRGVRLARGDMGRFALGTRFDVVTCLFSAIAYMETRRDRDRAIANFYRHLNPGGVALVEGWVRRSRWRGTGGDLVTYEDRDTRVARVTSSWREGNRSVVEFQFLVGERGKRIRHFTEVVRNPLVDTGEMLGSFRRAGFRAKVLLRGRYRDRGLYVGVRPTAS